MPGLQTQVTGAKEAEFRLRHYGRRLEDWSPLWNDFAEAFAKREAIWFDRQGEGSWADLSDPYAEWKAKVRPGKPKLVFDGDMRASLTSVGHVILGQSKTMLSLGTTDPKAKFHQKGTSKMPARPVLVPVLRLKAAFARLLHRHIEYTPGFGEIRR